MGLINFYSTFACPRNYSFVENEQSQRRFLKSIIHFYNKKKTGYANLAITESYEIILILPDETSPKIFLQSFFYKISSHKLPQTSS